MSEIALHALPLDEKKKMAIELRPFHSTREIAAILGIGTKRAFNWTRHLHIDRRRSPMRGKPSTERCNCANAIKDSRFDRYCLRKTTCFRCGKVIR
ncbi:MAG: hypothetical protein KGZ65_00010 [Sphingomonadales bacterium]|nr:hypothetical protein [Sphingomonadaceae bacterium]MBS3929589.1 hypothetical protein [Sphingomonadales bacterium]